MVLGLNEPQVWTLIGVFSAAIFGMQAIVAAGLRKEMQSLRQEMQSLRNELISRMEMLEARINARLDHLDRDVQFLMRKELGE
jgi:hypothetical protein